jgi:hypothetical protein
MFRQTNGQDSSVDQEACSVENTKTADQTTEGPAELGAVTAKKVMNTSLHNKLLPKTIDYSLLPPPPTKKM